jgi:signal transduction histidine kinase
MGGKILVESKQDSGTEFTLQFVAEKIDTEP